MTKRITAMLPNRPDGTQRTPRIVPELAAGRTTHAVWHNNLGGLTFQLGDGETREFLKWLPHGSGVDLDEEIRRLQWAIRYAAVPRVLKQGADDEGSWFVSAGLPGTSAVDDRWRQQPATAVRDACSPNTLIGEDGRWSAHVDLGALGVADRWADLAVATWSTEWNYGPNWSEPLLEAYGVAPDWDRISYYRLLWAYAD